MWEGWESFGQGFINLVAISSSHTWNNSPSKHIDQGQRQGLRLHDEGTRIQVRTKYWPSYQD